VPPVPGLDRAGHRAAGRLGVCPGSVPADDLDARVLAQPRLHDIGGPARQDIDPGPGLGVDQDGRVDLAAAQREVINSQHPGNGHLRQRNPQQRTQRSVPRQRNSEHRQQRRPGTAR
jgi:hypothetical protein